MLFSIHTLLPLLSWLPVAPVPARFPLTNTTNTAAYLLTVTCQLIKPYGKWLDTNAAVAAKTSALRAFVSNITLNAKAAVNAAIMPRRAFGRCSTYRPAMAPTSNTAAMIVLRIATVQTTWRS